MKYRFRVTLLATLLGLVGLVVTILGISAYWNAYQTARDLGVQLLAQLSLRITDQCKHQLHGAAAQVKLNRLRLESGRLKPDDAPALVRTWSEIMQVRPELARLSLGLPSGDWIYLRRTATNRVAIGELHHNFQTGKFELSNFWAEEYPNKRFHFNPDEAREDPRARPWYVDALKAGDMIWTESYVFFGIRGVEEAPGISCASPAFDKDGKLIGVVEASVDLYRLCANLHDMPVADNGFAFLVEIRPDRSRRIIAHPEPAMILREVKREGDVRISELARPGECRDQRVRDFMRQIPADLPHLADIKVMRFISEGQRYLGGYCHITALHGPTALICMMLPEQDIMANVYRHNWITLGVGISVLLIAVLLSITVSDQVTRLVRETEAIGNFHVDSTVPLRSIVHEVDRLGLATEQMKVSLRSFRKYVPADLVRKVLASGVEARLGGEEREVTVFFCDLAGFTTASEGLTPQALVEQLGDYFRALTEEVTTSDGTVDKFIGDAVMAFWGAPHEMPDHAAAACKAALACQRRLAHLREVWREQGKPEFYARIGINTGIVVVGNIGSEHRFNYTVIGDPVNVASRLEGLNKFFGTSILISDSTYQAVANSVVVRPIDWVSVKGKKEGGLVYELLGLTTDDSPDRHGHLARYSAALETYRRREWEAAAALFEQHLCCCPGDRASEALLQRCRLFLSEPPPSDWNGIFQMESK